VLRRFTDERGTVSATSVVLLVLAVCSTFGAAASVDARARDEAVTTRAMAVILLANLAGAPLVAFALVRGLSVSSALGLGVILAAAAPGGSTGPLLALLAKGDARVAVRVFLLSSALSAVLVPAVLVGVGLVSFDPLGLLAAFGGTLAGQTVPLALGAWVRQRFHWAPTAARVASRAGLALLLLVIAGYLATRGALLRQTDARALGVIAGTVIATLSVGAMIPGLTRAARASVAMVSAVRNLTLALLVGELLHAPATAIVGVLLYGLVMYLLVVPAAIVMRR
jgi:BASS family bile acid:Na+ symporter